MDTRPYLASQRTEVAERARLVLRFAELIRAGRRLSAHDGSQAAFADRIGVSRRTLQRMESGDPSVSLDAWLRAWQAVGLLGCMSTAIGPTDAMAIASAQAVAARAARRARAPQMTPDAEVAFPAPAPRRSGL